MFFTLPEDARWNADRQAVEFGVEIGEYHGVFQRSSRSGQLPSGASEPLTYSEPGSEHRRAEAAAAAVD